jgi:L-iditol 2-dehydrogenase
MKALLPKEYKKLETTEMPEPQIGPDDVLVQVKACGICGSDIHGFDGSTGRRIPPLIMGHEASGIVSKHGDNVTEFRPGDRVTFDSTVYCGKCYFCRRGEVNLCDNRQVLGVSPGEYRRHGAFAEYVSVPRHIVYPIPDVLSFEHAAMIEAVSVAIHAVGLTRVSLGDTAVVVGSGMIGLLVVQALRLAGCSTWIRRENAFLGCQRPDLTDTPQDVVC